MSDLNDYLTDEMVEKAAKAIDWKHHEYRVDSRTWIPSCVCGWTATESYDVEGFDRHITETVLLAVVPDIIRKAGRGARGHPPATRGGRFPRGWHSPLPRNPVLVRFHGQRTQAHPNRAHHRRGTGGLRP